MKRLRLGILIFALQLQAAPQIKTQDAVVLFYTIRDWDALLAMCTNDVLFAPPGERQVSGSKVRTWLDAFPVMKAFDFTFDRLDVSGDLATATGNGTWILDLDSKDLSASFKFTDVFRKDSEGKWRYGHVIWNSDTPA